MVTPGNLAWELKNLAPKAGDSAAVQFKRLLTVTRYSNLPFRYPYNRLENEKHWLVKKSGRGLLYREARAETRSQRQVAKCVGSEEEKKKERDQEQKSALRMQRHGIHVWREIFCETAAEVDLRVQTSRSMSMSLYLVPTAHNLIFKPSFAGTFLK